MNQNAKQLSIKPIIQNDDFAIFCTDDLEDIKDELLSQLSFAKMKLLKFFGLNTFPKVSIYLFDKNVNFKSLPSLDNYSSLMINHSYKVKSISKIKGVLCHELTHIVYRQIWEGHYQCPIWLDEGLALFFSGEKDHITADFKRFKSWYLERIVASSKTIPELEFLNKRGTNFGEFIDGKFNTYNGYDISFILVYYLMKQCDTFSEILYDKLSVEKLNEHILEECIAFFNRLFHVADIKEFFMDIETPYELMDYLDKNVVYGWLDRQEIFHGDVGEDFRENYRTGSLEQILQSKVGTCIEQAKLIKTFFDKIGLESKIFCRRKYEDKETPKEETKMHCFVLFSRNNKWYHFEHSNVAARGIHEYSTLEEALQAENSKRHPSDVRVLTEIPDIPSGLSFEEFNCYVNSFDPYDMPPKIRTI